MGAFSLACIRTSRLCAFPDDVSLRDRVRGQSSSWPKSIDTGAPVPLAEALIVNLAPARHLRRAA